MSIQFKKSMCGVCLMLAAVLPVHAESVSTGKAVLEWKDGVMEFRNKAENGGKVIFRPYFTNGVDIKTVKANLVTAGRKAILLHGKDCSLTFALSSLGAVVRVSAPKNAGFSVETATSVMVIPDGFAEDLILEPGQKDGIIPPYVPFFMGLQEQGGWTLSCIPYLARSEIRFSVDLRKWEFRPQPLEEYTFVIQSGKDIWKKVEDKLDKKERKPVAWKPPFPAGYRAAFPVAKDFFEVEKPLHQIWNVGEERAKDSLLLNKAERVTIVDKKVQTGWSSGFYGTFAYPAFLQKDTRQLLMVYPRHKNKQFAYDPNRPIYIYTFDQGWSSKRSDTPVNFLTEEIRSDRASARTSTIGIGPATCALTQAIEKIYYRGEARTKRTEVEDDLARIQIFVESIRARIGVYRAWAEKMKKACLAAAEKDSEAAPTLKKFASHIDCIEKVHQLEQAKMEYPEKVWELGRQLLKDLDDRKLDDEELEKRCKEYGRAVRTIGGAQDNCVAECRQAAKMIRGQILLETLWNRNPTVRDFGRKIYETTSDLLRDTFVHEGK